MTFMYDLVSESFLPLSILLTLLIVGGAVLGKLKDLSVAIKEKDRPETAPETPADLTDVWKVIGELEASHKSLMQAVAVGIEHVDRSERRVRATVKRAKKRFEESGYSDEGLEAEEEGIYLGDEDGLRQEELPLLQDDVEPDNPGENSPWLVVPGRLS